MYSFFYLKKVTPTRLVNLAGLRFQRTEYRSRKREPTVPSGSQIKKAPDGAFLICDPTENRTLILALKRPRPNR